MKKLLSLILVALMTLSLATAVFAEFVPSINEKPAPTVSDDGVDCDHENALDVIPVSDDGASDDLKDLLKDLEENPDDLPSDFENPVIRDLFEVEGCEHAEKELEEKGSVDVTYDLGVGADEEIEAFGFVNGVWRRLPLRNNGDGTVTVTLSAFGPIAFVTEGEGGLPVTGDFNHLNVLWISLMVVSLALIPVLAVKYNRLNKKADEQ